MKTITIFIFALLLLFDESRAADLNFNGFGSMYGGYNFTKGRYVSNFNDNSPAFSNFSLIGINLTSNLTEQIQFYGQFVADGGKRVGTVTTPEWEVRTNWAVVSFKLNENIHLKVGRQLYPNWLAAEFIDVGFFQPYRKLPDNVEAASPFHSFDGVLIDDTFDVGGAGHLSAAVFGGRSESDVSAPGNPVYVIAKNFLGSALTLRGDGYKFRARISRSSTYGTAGTNNAFADEYSYTLGGSYDKNNIVLWSEYGRSQSDETNPGYIPGTFFLHTLKAYYILAGYRFGPFMPRYMWSDADFTDAGFGLGRSFTHNVGLNYQIKIIST